MKREVEGAGGIYGWPTDRLNKAENLKNHLVEVYDG
jgi:hypothetical protein